jgi:transcriptional regulator with XRE-family HTH domain
MMTQCMDIFLQKFGLTRYDVFKRTGISQQTLSSANKKDPSSYSVKILTALSEATGISPGEVLDQLIGICSRKEYFVVRDWEELKIAVDARKERFIVEGEFTEVMKEVKRGQLSDTARLGTELGSGGSVGIIESLYYFVHRQLSGGNKEEEKLKDQLTTLYHIILLDEHRVELKLKSLSY